MEACARMAEPVPEINSANQTTDGTKAREALVERWLDTVQFMDCLEGMTKLPARSFDLVIADPPYNLSKGNAWKWDRSVKLPGFGGTWSKVMEKWDDMPLAEYWNFTAAWLSQAKRLLKPTGSIWVFGTYHNMGIVNVLFQVLGIEIINEIVWYKRNAFPNLSGRRFTASHETLLWGHVGGRKRGYLFNYRDMKNASFPEEPTKTAGKQMRTVWNIPNNKARDELAFGKHPTQKPLALTNRVVLATTKPEDTILIPFAGAGSECVSAKKLGRHFIAFEVDDKYVQITNRRLDSLKDESAQKRISEFDAN
jgi:site-specific DNA-methyltransferase (adenine-specific)